MSRYCENESCPASRLELDITELKGCVDTLTQTAALNNKHADSDRNALAERIGKIEDKLDRVAEELQKEVAKLIGKWSIIIVLISAMATVAITNVLDAAEEKGSLAAIPPKLELSIQTGKGHKNEGLGGSF